MDEINVFVRLSAADAWCKEYFTVPPESLRLAWSLVLTRYEEFIARVMVHEAAEKLFLQHYENTGAFCRAIKELL
jgi:hypothetical protein